MTTARQDRHRKTAARGIHEATAPVIESLEERQMLSSTVLIHPRSHMVMEGPAQTTDLGPILFKSPSKANTSSTLFYPQGNIRVGAGGIQVNPIRHLYGLDTLDAFNANFPLYTNKGDGQFIVVVGAVAPEVNDVPNGRKGNVNIFSTENGIQGLTTPVFIDNTLVGLNPPLVDVFGAEESTMQLEWAHAMAPAAELIFVEVPSAINDDGTITPGNLLAGYQQAIADLQLEAVRQINQFGPGGVITTSLSSVGEDPATTAQFDAMFASAPSNVSFIAPAGDFGSIVSTPSNSPFVTAVGGTFYKIDAAGNRIFETASLVSGGGQSALEPLPAFQQGVRIGRKTLPSRAVPDLALISQNQGLGVNLYFDPTPQNNAPQQHFSEEGTSVAAPVFAGMVADANELRADVGLGTIGNQLNATLYQGFKQYPGLLFHDITQGNNVLHPALKGFDLATGMGAPNAGSLIPYLAGTVAVNTNVKVSGFFSTGLAPTGIKTITFQGSGNSQVGSQYVSMSVPLNSSDAQSTTPSTITFTPSLITRNPDNSITGVGTVVVTTITIDPTTGLGVSIPQTFNVEITGVVRGKALQPRITGQFFAVDPTTGRRIPPGTAPMVQASFHT